MPHKTYYLATTPAHLLKPTSPIAEALPFKKIQLKYDWQTRVMFFDPSLIYARLTIDPFRRTQTHLAFKDLYPDLQNNVCSCGCGAPITGRRKRWASDDCTKFALAVWAIIDGQVGKFEYFVTKYNSKKCAVCRSRKDLKLDHKVPVKHGGGGCWLANYQLLCHTCHVDKTNKDFGWKQPILEMLSNENQDAKSEKN